MERIPQWKDIPKDFTPKTTEYYQKQQGYRPITNPSIIQKSSYNQSKVRQPSTMNTIRIADRQKLTQLVQCLAISETQRKHLEASINEISQQKQTLNDQLNILMQEKTKWIQSETIVT
ncbi:hypothetical protein BC833DRAFT_163433 [Globomyces pollinis-pini]|nr:hypothetical protein BC833DRAFT_163433 [Globomyces pollinis-pini]